MIEKLISAVRAWPWVAKPKPKEYFSEWNDHPWFRGLTAEELADWGRSARNVAHDPEVMAHTAAMMMNQPTEAQRKNEKLASLARYIEDARRLVDKRKAMKKRHSDVLAGIRQAQVERLEIETGKRVLRDRVWVLAE